MMINSHTVNKKSVLIFGMLFWLVSFSLSQQLPQYSQFGLNRFTVNPGVAGTEDFTYIQQSYRSQWQGIEGAPHSGYLSLHSPVGKRLVKPYVQSKSNKPWLSVGGILSYDKTGPTKQTAAHTTLAYNLPLSKRDLRISFGMNLGLKRYAYNPDGFTDDILDLNDPFVFNSYNKIDPDASLGVWLYSKHFFVGLSSFQLFANRVSAIPLANGNAVQHYYGMVGYKIDFDPTVYLVPSVLLKNVLGAPLSIDFNTKLVIQQKYWLGGNYRHEDSFAVFAGTLVAHRLEVSYSYDAITSNLRKFTSGSHEILLGYRIKKSTQLSCPSEFW